MAQPEHCQQGARDFQWRQSGEPQQPSQTDTDRRGEQAAMPSIAADPEGLPRGLASYRLPNDFWPEYRLEWEFCEQHDMPPVSLAEFADMRDFSDGVTVYLDIDQPEPPYERGKRPQRSPRISSASGVANGAPPSALPASRRRKPYGYGAAI
jgi:hypothetical protein